MRKSKLVNLVIIVVIFLSVPVTIFLVNRQTSFANKAYYSLFGRRAELVINLTSSAKIDSFPWMYFAQGGEEKQNMLRSVTDKVSKLSPEYIRIDHVLDFYDLVRRNNDGNLVYSWEKLDNEIQLILKTGAKPFISLSYMPKALSETTEGLPYSWSEWQEVVRKTVEHISGVGELSIRDVYYEVWNEPDLFGGFDTKGGKNYLTLYHYSHDAVVSAKNVLPYKVGGPAITGLSQKWFNDFFRYASKNNLRVDFFSWHTYSKNIQVFEEDVFNAMNWLGQFTNYQDCELIITESGMTGDISPVYDQKISAVHVISMYTSLFQKVDKLFIFEIKDGPGTKKYWGRWGLLTHEKHGIPEEKPRYKAIEFMKKTEGDWYPVYGQGTWVKALATERDGVIKILLVNYDPYGVHIENVPITLVNMPYKNFTVKKSEFLGSSTSYNSEIDDNSWSINQIMESNSALLLEIIPR